MDAISPAQFAALVLWLIAMAVMFQEVVDKARDLTSFQILLLIVLSTIVSIIP